MRSACQLLNILSASRRDYDYDFRLYYLNITPLTPLTLRGGLSLGLFLKKGTLGSTLFIYFSLNVRGSFFLPLNARDHSFLLPQYKEIILFSSP